MLPWISVLAILGLILMIAEILIPGFGIFGVLGVISLLSATLMAAKIYGTLVFLAMLIGLVLLFFIMLMIAKKSGLYNKVILFDRQEYTDFDEKKYLGLIGKIGTTQSTLRPYGVVDIDGENFDVSSLGDFIDKGKRVKVVQVTGKTVTVKEWSEEN